MIVRAVCRTSPVLLAVLLASCSAAGPRNEKPRVVVAQVSTHWPTRVTSCVARALSEIANSSTATPGRPSGVSPAASSRSIPASQPQAITEVAKPVAVRFGWANYPVVNLWNKAGLPASPFRTDDWLRPKK